jgi:hypothetical protein
VQSVPLLQQLLAEGGGGIIEKDIQGGFHFNGNFKNAGDLDTALHNLDSKYQPSVLKERLAVLAIFEQVFNHKAFTGRSGTFFAFEGLGSIYWHMVSKLLLAVEETCLWAAGQNADKQIQHQLCQHYYAIKEGIGVHKSPTLYGAFPTDPYSHTPFGKGAQQPGMTGQVKEDIISRFGELGVVVRNGRLGFAPVLLRSQELLTEAKDAIIVDTNGHQQIVAIENKSLLFTICQVPVVYQCREKQGLQVVYKDGSVREADAAELTAEDTRNIFERNGTILSIRFFIPPSGMLD